MARPTVVSRRRRCSAAEGVRVHSALLEGCCRLAVTSSPAAGGALRARRRGPGAAMHFRSMKRRDSGNEE